jgi:DNA-directed RNA polymerase subunit E'/Rpb7
MEAITKPPQVMKKRKDTKLQTIYSRCLLTRKLVLPITFIGRNLDDVIEEYISNNIEGKCVVEGFVKPNSSKIIRYSSGLIERGSNVVFEVVFECDICFPVEGMLISCVVKNIVKAGIRAESSSDVPSPFVAFIPKDHLSSTQHFNDVQVGDIITVRIIGQRFELNDKMVSIIGEMVKEKDYPAKSKQPAKPRLVLN